MKTVQRMLAATCALGLALGAGAPAALGATIDKRQETQQKRIEQGIQSGELNQREAARLQREQNRIEAMENKALADGTLSKAEKRRLQRRLNKSSRHIYREKHDAQKAQ